MSLKGFDIEVIFGYLNPDDEVHACDIKSQKAPGRSHYFLITVKADLIFDFSPLQCSLKRASFIDAFFVSDVYKIDCP
jgi:hypothetical protein